METRINAPLKTSKRKLFRTRTKANSKSKAFHAGKLDTLHVLFFGNQNLKGVSFR